MSTITVGASACSGGLVCWLDQHEGLGVWFGSAASLIVACVAVGVVFLQRHIDKARELARLGRDSLNACHHGRSALALIMDYQRDCFDRVQAPTGGSGRPWTFELGVAADALAWTLDADIWDPALVQALTAVLHWTRLARDMTEFNPQPALDRLQESTRLREQVDAALLRMQEQFLKMASGKRVRVREPS